MGEGDDLQESEMGFQMNISITAPDGLFTEQVAIEVRCPQINNLIIFNQAVVYRLDGEDIPIEVSPANLQKTIEAIITSYRKNMERKELNKEVLELMKENQKANSLEKSRNLMIQAAALIADLDLSDFLHLCGEAYSLVNQKKGGVT